MSVSNYEEFLNNPIGLDERYPTMEEFLLAIPHFFLRKDTISLETYEQLKSKIVESKKKKTNLAKKDVFDFLNLFHFGPLSAAKVWQTYVLRITQGMATCTKKNFYLSEIIRILFSEVWCLSQNNSDFWIRNIPNNRTPFTSFLQELEQTDKDVHNLLLKYDDNNNNLDNYCNWLKGAIPQIDSLHRFLETIKTFPIQRFSLSKEKILSYWFFQQLDSKYPFSIVDECTKDNNFQEMQYALKFKKLLAQIDTDASNPDYVAKYTNELIEAKKTWPQSFYGNLLIIDFKFKLHQRDFTGALELTKTIVPLYFYYGSYDSEDNKFYGAWYSLVLSFIAYKYTKCKEKKERISLKSLFKRVYNIGFILDMESFKIELDNKKKEEIILTGYCNKFKDIYLPSYTSTCEDKVGIPQPNYKKANQHRITWGTAKESPQLIFFTQFNEPDIVKKLLENGAQVAQTTIINESALYWCLKHITLTDHLSVGKTTLCPPEHPLRKSQEIEQYIYSDKDKPYYTFFKYFRNRNKTEEESFANAEIMNEAIEKSYADFKIIFDSQREKAKTIFYTLLPYYQNPTGNYPLDAFEKTTISKEYILNKAICTLDIDIIKAVIALYEKYLGLEKKKIWMNKATEFTPRTPIFWVVRLYEYKKNRKVHEFRLKNNPYLSNFLSLPNVVESMAQSKLDDNPNASYNLAEVQYEMEAKLSNPAHNFAQNQLQVWESRYIDETVSENNLLSILNYLLENEANPTQICDCSNIGKPSDYNAIKLAAEVGWLDGIKMMMEWMIEKNTIQLNVIEEIRLLAIEYEKLWIRGLGSNTVDHEERAHRCHTVAQYLQTLIPDSFYES